MNKKFLICGALAAGLLLTACVKKEAPKEDEQEHVETAASEVAPAEFQKLDATDEQEIPLTPSNTEVEVIREETPNTVTEVRREVAPAAEAAKPAPAPVQKAEAPRAEDKPTQAVAPKNTSASQSEDDAVAAAIAAATPALDN
ncbi:MULTISPECIES: internalin [unclassified Acinetobacter]|uniref:internalin n=1 Tax=unclassified Acinetobacter TaxID=196816 RepID=UPI000EA0A7F9|nr:MULTISPECIES: internalin [unclassified Acinetobacter]MBI1452404.1 internalin [Acinetobacter sp. FL51]RKG44655.1 internalin [Acinetobacter sp. WCHAc060007]